MPLNVSFPAEEAYFLEKIDIKELQMNYLSVNLDTLGLTGSTIIMNKEKIDTHITKRVHQHMSQDSMLQLKGN